MEKLLTEREKWQRTKNKMKRKIIQSKSIKGANVHISSIFCKHSYFFLGQLVGFLFNCHNCHCLILSQSEYLPNGQQTNQFTFHSLCTMRAWEKLHSFSYKMSHQKQYTKLKKRYHNPIHMDSGCDEIENIIMFSLSRFRNLACMREHRAQNTTSKLHGHDKRNEEKNQLVNRSKPFNFFAIFAECVSVESHHIAFFDFLFWRPAQTSIWHISFFSSSIFYLTSPQTVFLIDQPLVGSLISYDFFSRWLSVYILMRMRRKKNYQKHAQPHKLFGQIIAIAVKV